MKITSFEILMQLLRDRTTFLTEIEQQKNLDKKIVALLFCSSLFIALYGAIIGSTNGALQMLASAFKLPALYLLTAEGGERRLRLFKAEYRSLF